MSWLSWACASSAIADQFEQHLMMLLNAGDDFLQDDEALLVVQFL